MIDGGAVSGHSNSISFPDRSALDGYETSTIAFMIQPNVAGWVGNRTIFSKFTTNSGWAIITNNVAGANRVRLLHGDGGAQNNAAGVTDLASGTTYKCVVTWDGTNAIWSIDDVAEATVAFTRGTDSANANDIHLLNLDGLGDGAQCAIGQVMVWPNYELTAAEITQYNAGQTVPATAYLEFWHRGTAIPGRDEVRGVAGTTNNTVVDLGDPVDAFFPAERSIPQYRQVATNRLLRRGTEEEHYSLEVPAHFAKLEVGELINISHDGLTLTTTQLANIEDNGLMDDWRRMVGRVVGIEQNPTKRTVVVSWKDHESYASAFYSSDKLTKGTSEDFVGLSRADSGGSTLTVTRASKAYLVQANNVKEELTTDPTGTFYKQVGSFTEKMNHLGFLAEDTTQNPILNSVNKNGFTDWTQNANGGTLDSASTVRLAFDSTITSASWRFVRTDDTNDTYIAQQFAVLAADSYRRVYVTYTEEDANSVISWALQRDTDSKWWNDSTEAWEVAKAWNNLTNNYNTTISRSIIARANSNPINVAANENWTINIGLEGASLPAGGGEGNIYAVSALKGKEIYSEVITDDAVVTTAEDLVQHTLSSATHQLVPADRYEVTCRMLTIQDGSVLEDGTQFVLWYAQFTNTSNFDMLLYEKLVATSARFRFLRYQSGVIGQATYTIDIVPGTTYKLQARSCSTNGELGLAARTMSMLVGGVKGTDATPAALQSSAATATEFWRGSAPTALGLMPAMNYLWKFRVWPLVMSDDLGNALT